MIWLKFPPVAKLGRCSGIFQGCASP